MKSSSEAPLLIYQADARPGIERFPHKKGFGYRMPDGTLVTDSTTLARIKTLAIPPAWTDVWISLLANSHLQATGRDAKGRKQYKYHVLWREQQEKDKFDRLVDFSECLPRIRERVQSDLSLPALPREKILAAVVSLLENTLIRVGNDEYALQNRTYGLTTLRNRHVRIQGATIKFFFRGKSGKKHNITLHDQRLARIIKRCQSLPGQELFEYIDSVGEHHDITSQDVNAYIRSAGGGGFTAKDFRTWQGTVLAVSALIKRGIPRRSSLRKKNIVVTTSEVAGILGNTAAVCRKSYIHPIIFEKYLKGEFPSLDCQETSNNYGLTWEERVALAFISK